MTKLKKSKGQVARQTKAKRAAYEREKRKLQISRKRNANAHQEQETSSEGQYSIEDQKIEYDAESQEEEENNIQSEDVSLQNNDEEESQEQEQEDNQNYEDSSDKDGINEDSESGDEEEVDDDEQEEQDDEDEEEGNLEQNTEGEEDSMEQDSQISVEDNGEDIEDESNEEEENDEDQREDNGRKKIHRRRADEIEKEYKCRVKKCGRYYGSYPALYTHLKTKHFDLGGDKLYKIANRERRRLIKLEADRLNQINEDPEQNQEEEQEENSETEPIQKEELRKKIKGSNNEDEADKKKTKGNQKVKEFYVEEYMHLIKPSLVNENQIKKFMKDKRQQEEQYGFNQQLDSKEKSGRRMFGTVEQIIQKSINKQLALAEIKKQQRNLKMQKIDKDKMSELTVFQPAYLFDLVQQIDLSWNVTLKQEKQILKAVSLPQTLLLSNDQINLDEKDLKKKKQKKKEVLAKDDWLSDYPEINDLNQFLLDPLHKQLQFLRSVNTELGVEEIQGIGLRLAFALKHLHGFVIKPFYIEMVYIAGYLLRVLSIKKITLYQEISQDFLSIYEYVMNSVRYGGFADEIPIFAAFADLNRINSFVRDTLLALLKIVFKSSNAYSENLLKQFYHYNQAGSSY